MIGKNEFPDVICAGGATLDIFLQGPNDGKINDEAVFAREISLATGGDALNQAMLLSKLGRRVRFLSRIGCDAAGRFILDECRRHRIDTGYVKRDASVPTTISSVMVQRDGSRSFQLNSGSSAFTFCEADIVEDALCPSTILSYASIFTSPFMDQATLGRLFERASNIGCRIYADISCPSEMNTLASMRNALSRVDLLFPSYEHARVFTGEKQVERAASVFLEYGVRAVCMKCGADGAYYLDQSGMEIMSPAFQITPKDTTGAGDNFCAGYIDAVLDGKPVEECMRRANAVAAVCVMNVGATGGVDKRSDIEEFLRLYESNDK